MSTAAQPPVIHINNGKPNGKLRTTILVSGFFAVAGWIFNSETLMPSIIDFYTRICYGRELAAQMKPKSPEQIRLEKLEAHAEEEAAYRQKLEENRAAQDQVIAGMRIQSDQRIAAEKRRADEQQAELERLRNENLKIESSKPTDNRERLLQSGLDDNNPTVQKLREKIRTLEEALPRLEEQAREQAEQYARVLASQMRISTEAFREREPTAKMQAENAKRLVPLARFRIQEAQDKLRKLEAEANERLLNP